VRAECRPDESIDHGIDPYEVHDLASPRTG
jgi:hypothetical protein